MEFVDWCWIVLENIANDSSFSDGRKRCRGQFSSIIWNLIIKSNNQEEWIPIRFLLSRCPRPLWSGQRLKCRHKQTSIVKFWRKLLFIVDHSRPINNDFLLFIHQLKFAFSAIFQSWSSRNLLLVIDHAEDMLSRLSLIQYVVRGWGAVKLKNLRVKKDM